MAEENVESEAEEVDPVDESAQESEAQENDEAVESSADGSDSADSEDSEPQAENDSDPTGDISESNSDSANEASIGDEIAVSQSTRVSAADGSEIQEPIADISMLLDIPVTLSMEIGQTKISINDLLKLGKDSVIELQRLAHEPLDVLVNGTLIAHGEAVVVGDRFGIRLTDVISPQERLRKFG